MVEGANSNKAGLWLCQAGKLWQPTMSPYAGAAIFSQSECFRHCFIRSRDMSAVVERPERLCAVHLGISAAIARLEHNFSRTSVPPQADELSLAFERMNIASAPTNSISPSIPITRSKAVAKILNHPAVKYAHGDIDGDVYLENLQLWARESVGKISRGDSEIPDHLSQGDLYCE